MIIKIMLGWQQGCCRCLLCNKKQKGKNFKQKRKMKEKDNVIFFFSSKRKEEKNTKKKNHRKEKNAKKGRS
jgi:hypothetical protein